jgi:LPXTG-motif cell wall-anchored protein
LGTLLIAAGMLAACVGGPAALAWAQSPPAEPEVGGTTTIEEQAGQPPPPAPPPEPPQTPPPSNAATPHERGSSPGQTGSDGSAAPGASLAGSATPKTGSVSIVDGNSQSSFRFSPSSITVGAGDTVTWTNNGAEPHDVTGDGLSSGTLNPGQGYSNTFSSPGTFNYICTIHPFMKGSVTVQASGGGGSGGSGNTSGDEGPTGPGSESSAVTSSGAAGSDTQLPSTGMSVAPLLAVGTMLVAVGALLRRRARVS